MKRMLHHSHWHTSVHLHGQGTLYGRTAYLSTDLECAASLRVNVRTFNIESARWEVYRGENPQSADLEGLRGVQAYLGGGGALRQAAGQYGPLALGLVSETVRGVIQAETFVFTERGYPDAKSYDDFWEKMYLNTCRYYSNLDRISHRWEDHVSAQKRFGNLFNRFKSVALSGDDTSLHVCASLSDSFHELGLVVALDKNEGSVTSADCRLLRCPDPVCSESGEFARNLVGKRLAGLNKKELAGLLAGSQGCVHIIDLCHDVSTALQGILQG